MAYRIMDFTHGCEPLECEYHFYEEAREELEYLSARYPEYRFGIEEVPDIEDLEVE